MSQSVTTLTNGGSAVLGRRSEFNLGVEDRICDLEDDEEEEDERDVTLRRPDPGFHFGTARKVNGTSERNQTGGGNKNKKFGFFPNKSNKNEQKEAAEVNRTPRRVERSKSELGGEQIHKKLIPTLSQGKPDLSETNKKILAHWNSGVERGMKLFQYGFTKTKWEDQPQQQQQHKKMPEQTSEHATAKMSTLGAKPINKSVDGLQQSLQNVLTLKKHFDASQIFSTLTLDGDKTLQAKTSSKRDSSFNDNTPEEKDCLQKFLEMDHGEFQFIDDSVTLTRGISPPATSANLSISSLASEIFQELGQTGLNESSPKPEVPGSSRFRHHHQRRQRNLSSASMSAVPLDVSNGRFETSPWAENIESNRRFQNNSQIDLNATSESTLKPPATSAAASDHRRQRRQRNLSSASMSAVVLADESANMTTSWNGENDVVEKHRPTFQNDSQLIASLIADQTLFLRHHQKRKQQRRRQQLWPVGKYQQQQQQQLVAKGEVSSSQQQLIDQPNLTAHHSVLRRCSSLTHTYPDEEASQDASLISSVIIADNGSSRLSSPSTNVRFLYSGKYRPTFQQDPQTQPPQHVNGNNNHDDNAMASNPTPWVLSNKLSSFSRRRRSSSTSLHTYDDDNDENSGHQFLNNNKKLNGGNGDSVVSDYR